MNYPWVLVAAVGCLLAFTSADPEVKQVYGDESYLEMEKDLLLVLKYVHQPYWHKDLYAFGAHYNITEDAHNYLNATSVKLFMELYNRHRLLPHKDPFSLYNEQHLYETKAVFDLLYTAKNYETLAKVIAWARFNINEKMFMYVMGVLISHRKDVQTLIMPPPYEVCPYQFVNAEVIKSAQRLKMQGFHGVEKVNGLKEVIIPMNYTGWYMHMNRDQKLTYYTEDVGLNGFYYNVNLDYPHWMHSKEYGFEKDRRGEIFLILHLQMVNRYYLERLSNDLGHVPQFNWREPIESGYYPSLMYVSGKQFKTRSNHYSLYTEGNHKFVQEAEDRERRIRDVIDQGFIEYNGEKISLSTPEDLNTIGNLLHGNPDAFDFHHHFHDHIIPTFLENSATAARDPLFYQFYQRLMSNYWRYMSYIKPYTLEQVDFPGVKITGVHVDKIQTYFQHFDLDITNAIDTDQDKMPDANYDVTEVNFKPDEYMVKARSLRLNHKPFSYTINVESEVNSETLVRIFLGPKFDEFGSTVNFNEHRKHFVMFDIFIQNIKIGKNDIVRKSTDIMYYGEEQTTFYELYKNVMSAKKGETKWTNQLLQGRCQFPKYLMVPKGKQGGLTYQFYIVVSKYIKPKTPFSFDLATYTSCGVGTGARFLDDNSMLYPIDREIDAKYFYTPNMHFEDVEIHFNPEENASRYY